MFGRYFSLYIWLHLEYRIYVLTPDLFNCFLHFIRKNISKQNINFYVNSVISRGIRLMKILSKSILHQIIYLNESFNHFQEKKVCSLAVKFYFLLKFNMFLIFVHCRPFYNFADLKKDYLSSLYKVKMFTKPPLFLGELFV